AFATLTFVPATSKTRICPSPTSVARPIFTNIVCLHFVPLRRYWLPRPAKAPALCRARLDQHAALHVLWVQGAVVPEEARSAEVERDALPRFHHLDLTAVQEADRVREVVVVRPRDCRAGLNGDVLGREAVRPGQIDLIRGDRGRWCGRLAAGGKQERKEDGECRAEGMPGTRAEEESHGQRGVAAPDARRTVQLKMRMKARRSSTSLTVWANRKTVQSRW